MNQTPQPLANITSDSHESCPSLINASMQSLPQSGFFTWTNADEITSIWTLRPK